MKWAEPTLGLVLVAVAGVWASLASSLPLPPFALASGVSPSYYPTAVAVLLGGLGAILSVRTLWGWADEKGVDSSSPQGPVRRGRVLLGLGLFLAYVLALPAVGFALGSLCFLSGFLHWMGRYSIFVATLFALLISGTLGFVFEFLLNVPLPAGPWGI